MRPSEVAIIVAVLAVIGYLFYKEISETKPAALPVQTGNVRFISARGQCCGNPTNATTPIYGPTMFQLTGTCEEVIPA